MSITIQADEIVRPTGASGAVLCPAKTTIHTGRTAVLAQAAMLQKLAGHCGQSGAMHGLGFLLDQEYAARKTPHLVRLHSANGGLVGAVLLLEYRLAGWKTGMMATGDSFGVRTVIGPEPLRPQIAVEACSAVLARGANLVLASFKQHEAGGTHLTVASATTDCLWAMQTRTVRDHLPLAETYDATLARMGKRTRNHLRYYRKRLENAVPCEFHADAGALIEATNDAVLAELNRRSLKPIVQATFNLQLRTAASLPGGFLCGLRGKDGVWLALAGGWRQGNTTWVQWQSNRCGYEEYSLSTVLRAFLIEREVARGAKKLAFHGGTSHSMSHAFPEEPVVDLLARRQGLSAAAIVRLIPVLYRLSPSLATRGNFLADVLSSSRLRWFPERVLPNEFTRRFTASQEKLA